MMGLVCCTMLLSVQGLSYAQPLANEQKNAETVFSPELTTNLKKQGLNETDIQRLKEIYNRDLEYAKNPEAILAEDRQEKEVADVKNELRNKQITSFSKSLGTYGDILVSYDYSWGGVNVALVGHAAIVSNNSSKTVESKTGDGVQFRTNDWGGRSKVYGLSVKGASLAKYRAAATYSERQEGKPYNWVLVNPWRTDQFYCSQLVWRAWKEQGIDVDYLKVDPIISPMELVKSNNTKIFHHRG